MTHLTRRWMLGALPALGLTAPAFAQTPPPQTGSRLITPSDLEDEDYALDAWVDMYGRPTAKVMINGKGPFQFMVDTGSTTTVIAARLVETLATPSLGSVTVIGTTGTTTAPLVNLGYLSTGAVRKDNLPVAVLPDNEFLREDGILGADVFLGRRLVFDIRDKVVRIEPTKRRIRPTLYGNMRVRNGLLAEVEGRIGDVGAKFMLDTGAQDCIANMALSEALLRIHPRLKRVDNARVFGVTGHMVVGQFIGLPRVDLKAFTVRDAGCVAADAPIFAQWGLVKEPAMIVGVSLLSRLDSFSIDYGAKEFDAKLASALMARNQAAFG